MSPSGLVRSACAGGPRASDAPAVWAETSAIRAPRPHSIGEPADTWREYKCNDGHRCNGERRLEFKRATAIERGPALDFERVPDAPAALIEGPLRAI